MVDDTSPTIKLPDAGPPGGATPAPDAGAATASGDLPRRPPLIAVRRLAKSYAVGQRRVAAVRDIALDVDYGEFVAVMGPSGSGKSTFMNVVGCLDKPSAGTYELDGVLVTALNKNQLADFRSRKLGFVFQGFNLLPRMDALANVELPMVYSGVPDHIRHQRGHAALAAVGLEGRADHQPNQLSGGQQQRVAIARALVNTPSLILADEPTGNLDSRTSVEIMAILQRLNGSGATILLVTHEPDIAGYCRRKVVFRDGHLRSDEPNRNPVSAVEALRSMPREFEDEEDEAA